MTFSRLKSGKKGLDGARASLPAARGPRLVWALAGCMVLVGLGWNTPFLLPLKWLVVFFHELSHALVAWATGGRVLSLNITHQQGGISVAAGGNRMLTLLAGYPGSLCWGLAAVFLAQSRGHAGSAVMGLGILLLAVAGWWVRPVLGFGFAFAVVSGVLFVYAGRRGSVRVAQYVLLLVGTTSCAYALIDIQQDVFHGRGGVSDATLLAAHTGVPFWCWGLLWYAASLGILVVAGRRLWRMR